MIGVDLYGIFFISRASSSYLLDRYLKKYGLLMISHGSTQILSVESVEDRENCWISLYCPMTTMNDSVYFQKQNQLRWTFVPMATSSLAVTQKLESYTQHSGINDWLDSTGEKSEARGHGMDTILI